MLDRKKDMIGTISGPAIISEGQIKKDRQSGCGDSETTYTLFGGKKWQNF